MTMTGTTTIDATTQPGYAGRPLVELNGTYAGSSAVNGLSVSAGNSVIKGLAINRFGGVGGFTAVAGSTAVSPSRRRNLWNPRTATTVRPALEAVSGGWSNTLPTRSRVTPTRRSAADSSRRASRTIVCEVSPHRSSSWLMRWALEAPRRKRRLARPLPR